MWRDELLQATTNGRGLSIYEQPLTGGGVALALAPHPDDPDVIGVTLRLLAAGGWRVHWAVVCSGWSGVLDDVVGPDRAAKGRAREAEERQAAQFFTLPEERLVFLRLPETDEGLLAETEENRRRLFAVLDRVSPDLVLLPNREDNHPDHRLCYAWFAAWARQAGKPVTALGNEDPKTVDFHPDFQVIFGEESAAWKRELLECHRSQSLRNQQTRGMTLAARILAVNRGQCAAPGMYAERFQVAYWPARTSP